MTVLLPDSQTLTPARAGVSSPRDLINQALTAIARKHGITLEKLKSKSRLAACVEARRDAYRMLHAAPYNWSTPRIGAYFGRDHSTVVYAIAPEERREALAARKRRYHDVVRTRRALNR